MLDLKFRNAGEKYAYGCFRRRGEDKVLYFIESAATQLPAYRIYPPMRAPRQAQLE